MAGDWIKVEHATPDKPEVVGMSDLLNIEQDAVVGKLLRLWIWTDQQSVSGNALSVTDTFIDRYTFCPGFANALRKVGWLEGHDRRLSIPNFSRHNGQTAKQRANTLKRVHKSRENCNAVSVTKALPEIEAEKEKSSKKKTTKKADLTDHFAQWWSVYPKRVGKDRAEQAYAKAVAKIAKSEGVETEEAAELLLRWTRERAEVVNSLEEKYRPHPATWLNAGHYTDELVVMGPEPSLVASAADLENWRP